MSFRYRAFGLSIRSDVELPELDEDIGGEEDLTIRLVTKGRGDEEGIRSRITPHEVYTFPPHVGRCWIRDGREIELEPAPGVDLGVIRLFLLGTAMGVILHQRGSLVLHASSIMIGRRAVAFVGESGSGKSTLAATFDRLGHPVIADDIAAIRFENGVPEVASGFRQIRIWPDSATATGYDPATLPRLHGAVEKRWLRPTKRDLPTYLPLAALFILERSNDADHHDALLCDAGMQERILELVRHTFTARMLSEPTVAGEHFRQCAALVRAVPVHRLLLSSRMDRLPMIAEHIVSTL